MRGAMIVAIMFLIATMMVPFVDSVDNNYVKAYKIFIVHTYSDDLVSFIKSSNNDVKTQSQVNESLFLPKWRTLCATTYEWEGAPSSFAI